MIGRQSEARDGARARRTDALPTLDGAFGNQLLRSRVLTRGSQPTTDPSPSTRSTGSSGTEIGQLRKIAHWNGKYPYPAPFVTLVSLTAQRCVK